MVFTAMKIDIVASGLWHRVDVVILSTWQMALIVKRPRRII
jgi:hypothetical protein